MKTISELESEIIECVARQRAAILEEFQSKILHTNPTKSRRELLGLDRRHKYRETPLFETQSKMIF